MMADTTSVLKKELQKVTRTMQELPGVIKTGQDSQAEAIKRSVEQMKEDMKAAAPTAPTISYATGAGKLNRPGQA